MIITKGYGSNQMIITKGYGLSVIQTIRRLCISNQKPTYRLVMVVNNGM